MEVDPNLIALNQQIHKPRNMDCRRQYNDENGFLTQSYIHKHTIIHSIACSSMSRAGPQDPNRFRRLPNSPVQKIVISALLHSKYVSRQTIWYQWQTMRSTFNAFYTWTRSTHSKGTATDVQTFYSQFSIPIILPRTDPHTSYFK